MDPFIWLSQRQIFKGILSLLPPTLGAFFAIAATNQPLQNDVAPLGIISLQVSGTPPRAVAILDSWGETERIYAAFNLGLDYLYLFCYSVFLSLICAHLARAQQCSSQRLSTAGVSLAWALLVAAVFDMVENYALLQLLSGQIGAQGVQLAAICAILKFGIVLAGFAYITISLFRKLVNACR